MKKLIIISLYLLLLNNCSPDVRYERAFGLEYYLITPYPMSDNSKDLLYYFYIKNSDGREKEKAFQKQLLQLAFCRFNSNHKIQTIFFTAKFFENFEELGYHTMYERKIIANIGYRIKNDVRIPYFQKPYNGFRYSTTYKETSKIDCPLINMW